MKKQITALFIKPMGGLIITLLTIFTIHLLRLTPFAISSPMAPLSVVAVFSVLRGGIFYGFISSLLSLLYYSSQLYSQGLFTNDFQEFILRMAGWGIAMPLGLHFFNNFKLRLLKESEYALSRNHKSFQKLLHNSHEGVWMSDTQGYVTYINSQMSHILGYTAEEMVGRHFSDFIFQEDLQTGKENLKKRNEGKSGSVEFRLKRKDGTDAWVLVASSPLFDVQGKISGILGLHTDITSQKYSIDTLTQITESIPQIVWSANQDGSYNYFNQKWFAYTGLKTAATQEVDWKSVVHPDDYKNFITQWSEATKKGEEYEIKYRLKRASDQTYRWHLRRATPIRNNQLEISQWFGTCTDIHFQLTAETAIRESEVKFRGIYDSNMFGIIFWSPDGRVIDANDEFLRLVGYSREDLVNGRIDWKELTPKEFLHLDLNAIDELVTKGKCHPFEKEYIRKDGTRLPVMVGGSLLTNASGEDTSVAFVVDNSIPKKAEAERTQHLAQIKASAEIKSTKDFLDSIVDNLPNMIFIKEAETLKFIKLNKAGENLLGVEENQIVGKSDYDFFPREQADFFTKKDREVLLGEQISDIPEEEVSTSKKGKRILHTKKMSLLGPDGKSRYLLGISEDITELKRFQEDLVQAREAADKATLAKSEFLAHMSHEIRTPMNGVIGMAGVLSATSLNEKQRAYVEIIKSSGELLLNIIDEILDFSKIEAGKVSLNIADFDLSETIHLLEKLIAPNAVEKDLNFLVDLDSSIPTQLEGDSGKIGQVLINLVHNAIKFTDHGNVHLKIRNLKMTENKVKLRFEIIDTGIGVPVAQQKRLFESFSQADPKANRRYGGTGLGLVISKRLVQLMGGELGFESIEGKGSTFWFTLELKKGLNHLQAPIHKKVLVAKTPTPFERKVLLVEDNIFNQEVARAMLEGMGFQADIAKNGREAIHAIRNNIYDCVLMDCQMPEMDGFEATVAIRKQEEDGKRIPIIAMTANALSDDEGKCLKYGMDDYISKPVNLETFTNVLTKWCAPQGEK